MGLMRDEELLAKMSALLPGSQLTTAPYSKDSPVQASSLDLHIGKIYLPGRRKSEPGGADNPKFHHMLKTGGTAVLTTQEQLQLPDDVAGFGFPPSRVSFKGLLMTNPGHVDPGYVGALRFTVINMSSEGFDLNSGDRIVRLLLFKLDAPVHAGFRARNPQPIGEPTDDDISRLSEDFVNVDRRAKKIARKQGIRWSSGIAVVGTIIVAGFQLWSSGSFFSSKDVQELKKRQDLVEYDLNNRVKVEQRLQDFDARLKELELEKAKASQGKHK